MFSPLNTMNRTLATSARAAVIAAAFVSVGITSASAQIPTADWYMIDTQAGDNHWNSVSSTASFKHWADAPTLPGYTGYEDRYATAMDANAVYYVAAGKMLRTPGTNTNAATHDTFAGGTLILAGADLLQRSTGTRIASVADLITLNGTTIRSGQSTIQNLSVTDFNAYAGTTSFTSQTGRGFNLSITNLSGAADLVFTNGGTYNLNIGNTANFTGNMSLTAGTSGEVTKLGFLNNLSFDGSLIINGGNTVNLTHAVSVSALSINGDVLGAGTYNYSWLSQNYATIFTAGNANGMITVTAIPEPSTAAALAGLGVLGLACLRRRRQ